VGLMELHHVSHGYQILRIQLYQRQLVFLTDL
jgi:hypothetical protein